MVFSHLAREFSREVCPHAIIFARARAMRTLIYFCLKDKFEELPKLTEVETRAVRQCKTEFKIRRFKVCIRFAPGVEDQ
jgi:hypothetical protein